MNSCLTLGAGQMGSDADGVGRFYLFSTVRVCLPVLLFLGVFVSLVFFLLRNSLVFLSVSAYFPGFSRVRKVEKSLVFLRFSLPLSKRPRKRRIGLYLWKHLMGFRLDFNRIFNQIVRIWKRTAWTPPRLTPIYPAPPFVWEQERLTLRSRPPFTRVLRTGPLSTPVNGGWIARLRSVVAPFQIKILVSKIQTLPLDRKALHN